jgi:Gluconate 2-dehydrogenase subunit 3
MNRPDQAIDFSGDTAPRTMNRRDAIRRIALLMGGTMVGAEIFLRGQTLTGKNDTAGFTAADRALLDEIGETIIPATDIPGAKAVNIGAFMAMMVTDCYNDREQAIFQDGLGQIDEACRAKYGKSFLDSTPAQRTELANELDAVQRTYQEIKARRDPPHYFRMMKELTILGYFTSETGCTKAVRFIEVPGSYNGDVPYQKGDKAWFS